MTNDGKTLRALVGRRVRSVRVAGGMTVDDIARAAMRYGLRWNVSRVRELERGSKAISGEELLLLPRIVSDVLGRTVTLAELLDSDEELTLASDAVTTGRNAAQLAGDRPDAVPILSLTELDAELVAAIEERDRRAAAMREAAAAQEWARGAGHRVRNSALIDAERDAGEAETKAAAKLGVSRAMLIYAAVVAWGRSLTAERDHRVDTRAPAGAAPRSIQAVRGRVTRELVDQLRELLNEGGTEDGTRPVER